MADDLARINARLNQLMAQNIAHRAMLQTLLGMLAAATPDWRGKIDDLRMMTEFAIKSLVWDVSESEGTAMRTEALDYLQTTLDDLHAAMVRGEQDDRPPDPSSPSSI